ncbi:YybH family protein [Ancylobacter terrae]|uniref:YybH family protein n=1 Tax=Ancylobacter sp. sgz301288 TaxID=3342077 RepID=UPI00385C9590
MALAGLAALGILLGAGPAAASDEQAIREALARWAENFNAGRGAEACTLFAPELRFDYRGAPERGYAEMCAQLKRATADPERRMRYAADIREVIVEGDIAIVRLVWTLTIAQPGKPDIVSTDRGLDVFRRQPDGAWRIVRYLAYDE